MWFCFLPLINKDNLVIYRTFLGINCGQFWYFCQGWEFAHSLICSSLIRSSLICSFAHLLRSLKSNEQLWAIPSDYSGQMRDCERIVQVTHVKKATVSESLRSLKTNERISESFVFSEQITHLLFCSQKPAIFSNFFLTKIKFLKRFLSIFFKQAICSFPLFNEGMSNVSESLRSFTKNEWPCGILSGLSPKMSKWANCLFFEQIDHLLIFSQKKSYLLRKPMSEFPTLILACLKPYKCGNYGQF